MVVSYLARTVLETPLSTFIPSYPLVWQTRCDISSSTVRLHRLFDIIFLNDCHDRVTVFVFSASSPTLVHDTLSCAHDHSTTPLVRPTARLPRHRLPNFRYIDHGYSTHGFIDHGSFALATSTWHKGLSSVLNTPVGFFSSPSVRCSRLECGGIIPLSLYYSTLISVIEQKHDKVMLTCAFDMDTNEWDMVDGDNNGLPFFCQAVPLGGNGNLFVARSMAGNGGAIAAAVYHIRVKPVQVQPTCSGTRKTELSMSIHKMAMVSKGIVPGQFLCSLGKSIFSSIEVRSAATPGPDAKLHKARIIHRIYSHVGGDDDDAKANDHIVITKQHREIYKLIDRTLSFGSSFAGCCCFNYVIFKTLSILYALTLLLNQVP
uniref:Uncharacterized protein n=1 Tax=Oryza punctata TaxID=4537 RepID=A0A0E0JE13_ORYPU